MSEDSHRALLSAQQLIGLQANADNLVLLDVRWQLGGPSQYPAYLTGRIPGARWCDLDADLADSPGDGGRHPLPDPARLQSRFTDWGITPRSEVVVYDGGSSVAAARAWWVLRWAGVRQVRVLDGGFTAWVEADQPVETELPGAQAGTRAGTDNEADSRQDAHRREPMTVRPGTLPVLDADTARAWAEQGRLVDVRAPERFRGDVEPMDPVAGHIPGALNVPTTGNAMSSGRFKPAAALRRRFGEAGIDGQAPVGVYCGSGVNAAHTALAMELAGIEAVLYPGSWSEWITDPERPVATG